MFAPTNKVQPENRSIGQEHVMNKCSRDSNVHNGEVIRPILQRNEFVTKYLFKILYWNSRDFVSTRTLKGSLYISRQSKHSPEYRSVNFFGAVGVLSYFARISL